MYIYIYMYIHAESTMYGEYLEKIYEPQIALISDK